MFDLVGGKQGWIAQAMEVEDKAFDPSRLFQIPSEHHGVLQAGADGNCSVASHHDGWRLSQRFRDSLGTHGITGQQWIVPKWRTRRKVRGETMPWTGSDPQNRQRHSDRRHDAGNAADIRPTPIDRLVYPDFSQGADRQFTVNRNHDAILSGRDQTHGPGTANQKAARIQPLAAMAISMHQAVAAKRTGRDADESLTVCHWVHHTNSWNCIYETMKHGDQQR